jgi:hypothetical protein
MTQKGRLALSGLIILLLVVIAVVRSMLRKMDRDAAIRIARTGGVLMATNEIGLRYLDKLYALPKSCTKENFADTNISIHEKLSLCARPPQPLNSQMIGKGTVLIPEGSSGIALQRRLLFPMAAWFCHNSLNSFDMARDGWIPSIGLCSLRPNQQ